MLIRHVIRISQPNPEDSASHNVAQQACGLFIALGAKSAAIIDGGLAVVEEDGSSAIYQYGDQLVFNRWGAYRVVETPPESLVKGDRIVGCASQDPESDVWDAIFTLDAPGTLVSFSYRFLPVEATPEIYGFGPIYIPQGTFAYQVMDSAHYRQKFHAGMEVK